MIRLAFLLLGSHALRPQWGFLAILGMIWSLLGILMLIDLTDGKMSILMDTLGILLGVHGVFEIVSALVLDVKRHIDGILRGVAFLVTGFLVADIPWDNNIASTILFGAAFMIDGALRIASALVVHSPRWRQGLIAGLIELNIGIVIYFGHPVPHRLTAPFCLALLLLTSGYALLMMAIQLRNLKPGSSVTSLPLYAARNWHARHELSGEEIDAQQEFPDQKLYFRVWTALGSADGGHGPIIVRRYIAAIDRKGVVSTGHAVLELPPDLYVSHYPAEDIDRDSENFRQTLHSGHQNNVAGRFLPSYEEEVASWCSADQTVIFTRYNPAALRAFWQNYSKDSTYNLTARNCSSSAILALDAAIEGVLDNGKPLRSFLSLLTDPNLWLLWLVRGRAELMTWTPGLALDYARLLVQITEHADHRWLDRLKFAWKNRHLVHSDRNKVTA